MKFDPNANPPCFSDPDEQISIERNARVRLKILGTRVDATEIVRPGFTYGLYVLTLRQFAIGPTCELSGPREV